MHVRRLIPILGDPLSLDLVARRFANIVERRDSLDGRAPPS